MGVLPGRTQQDTNRIRGKFFEEALQVHARLRGFFIRKNELTAKFISKKQTLILKSELDFTIIRKDGRVGFFDCKAYDDDFFTFSKIPDAQLKRSADYVLWNVPSGFFVWFRKINDVRFYPGDMIQRIGKNRRFTATMGVPCGRIEGINVGIAFIPRREPLDPPLQADTVDFQEPSPHQDQLPL